MRIPRRYLRRLGMFRADRPGATQWVQQEPKPPDCPAGWSIGPPDFVGVGAQKAGTTWWFHLLAAHPDVYQDPNQRPELHFWDRFSHRWPTDDDVARYHRFFPRPPGAKTGEKTPDYMYDYWAGHMIKLAAPDTRIIALLRDPVERYRSATAHGADKGWIRDRLNETDVFQHGLYAGQVARLLDLFGAERTLVLQYERCVSEPQAQLTRTYEFLGLAPFSVSADLLARRRNVTPGTKADIDQARLATLRTAYRRDVRQLCDLVPDLDLALWPNFARLD
jgi:Sulfotransferase family